MYLCSEHEILREEIKSLQTVRAKLQQRVQELEEELKVTKEEAWTKVTHWSISVVFTYFVLFGVGGYLTFKENTEGNLLENYCYDDTLMNISRLLYAIKIILTCPIECFVAF